MAGERNQFRVESDSMGQIEVPAEHYWGAQTQRSLIHFAIGHETMPRSLIRAIGILKKSAAELNRQLGQLDQAKAELIGSAADADIRCHLATELPLPSPTTSSLLHTL